MHYEILTQENIRHYIQNTPALVTSLGEGSLDVSDIADGNLNQVFLVKSSKNALIIKQALPYLRCIGEEWSLSRDRIRFEIAALEKFRELAPQHVPEILHKDDAMSLVAMEYLGNHQVTRQGMINSIQYPQLAEHLATFLSETLFKTSSYYLSSTEKRKLEQQFSDNHDLCKLTEDFVFTFPYLEHDTNHAFPGIEPMAASVRENDLFKARVLELKYAFMNQRDALLHADLHTGSLMSNAEETYVIDPEFAFFGPFGFDIGALIANLVLAYVSHHISDQHKDYTTWLLDTLETFLLKFESKFINLWQHHQESALLYPNFLGASAFKAYQKKTLLNIFQQSIGFAGCKMARRILGIAGVADIRNIQNPTQRLSAEKLALKLGVRFVEEHHTLKTTQDLLKLILEVTRS